MKIFVLLGVSALLAGCVTNQPEVQKQWARTDGKQISASVALQQQFETDKTVCDGEVAKSKLGYRERRYASNGSEGFAELGDYLAKNHQLDTVIKGCMAGRGYVFG